MYWKTYLVENLMITDGIIIEIKNFPEACGFPTLTLAYNASKNQ
jgi:hypothetical protein